jgi:hypothetical protein
MSIKKEKQAWKNMLDRCYNPNATSYRRYGGRGITVCEAWRASFWEFYADMGPSKADLTLERLNNDGNYEPSNCKWATRFEQSRNKTNPKRHLHLQPSERSLRKARWAKQISDYKVRQHESL